MNNHGSRNRRDYVTSRLRLRDYNYSDPGYYFVTVCTQNRIHMFGHVHERSMCLNPAGRTVDLIWNEIAPTFSGVTIDCWVTMPNHVHALIGIGVRVEDPPELASLIDVMQRYKSLSTHKYINGVKQHGWSRFDGKLWQSGFHDHIVRNDRQLEILRNYVVTNPERWEDDKFHDR